MDFGVNSDIKDTIVLYAFQNTEGVPVADQESVILSTIAAYFDDEDALAAFRN